MTLVPTVGSHAVAAASSASTRRQEEAQFDLGEGPTRDAYSSGQLVEASDLESYGGARWPGYTPAALAAGIGAVFAFPLRVGGTTLGVLTLYLSAPRTLDRSQMRAALVFAELVTELLMDSSMSAEPGELDSDHHVALSSHTYIYQAQGMVMVDLQITLPEALARMRAHAYATGQDLAGLATDIISGRTRLPRDTP